MNSVDLRALAANLEEAVKVLRATADLQDRAHQSLVAVSTATPGDLSDLGLCVRTRRALAGEGIRWISQLVTWTADDLLQLRGIGIMGLEEIKEQLESRGMSLAQDDTPATAREFPAATTPESPSL